MWGSSGYLLISSSQLFLSPHLILTIVDLTFIISYVYPKSFILSLPNYLTSCILSVNSSTCIIIVDYRLSLIIISPNLLLHLCSFSHATNLIFLILIYFQQWTQILVDHHRVTTAKDFNSSNEDSSNDEDISNPWTLSSRVCYISIGLSFRIGHIILI